MITRRNIPIRIAVAGLLVLGACDSHSAPTDDEDHEGEQVGAVVDDHDEEVHAASEEPHDSEDLAGEPGEGIVLTTQQRERIGLRMQPAAPAMLGLESRFPGEVILVPDRVTHVVPQAPGVVRETFNGVRDRLLPDRPAQGSGDP